MKTGSNPKFSGIKIKSFHCSLPNEFYAVMEGRHSVLGCPGEIKVAYTETITARGVRQNMTRLNSKVNRAAPRFGRKRVLSQPHTTRF